MVAHHPETLPPPWTVGGWLSDCIAQHVVSGVFFLQAVPEVATGGTFSLNLVILYSTVSIDLINVIINVLIIFVIVLISGFHYCFSLYKSDICKIS